jgi:hypothetical protein
LLLRGNTRQCEQLLTYINKAHKNLTFTAEYEINRTLNFLDLSITKDKNQKHSFNIYRKPTTTDTLIHSSSNHPTQHKHAAFHSMIHRLNNIPMSIENYNTEVNTIKFLAQSNGYDHHLIDKIIHKTQNKRPHTTTDKKFITLTYINKHSNRIANKFKKAGYKIAFRTLNKTKYALSNRTNPSHTDKFNNPGIYKLNCTDCDQFYIGQTGRNFKIRYKEHIQALSSTKESTFANHLIKTGHKYKNIHANLDILHVHKKGPKLNTLEQYEIYRHTKINKTNILNEQTNFKSHTLFEYILNGNLSAPISNPMMTSLDPVQRFSTGMASVRP